MLPARCARLPVVSPTQPVSDDPDEQSEAERLEIARRYRASRGAELKALAAPLLEREPVAAGEFSTVPLESLAAIPLFGAFFALAARTRGPHRKQGPDVLLALDADQLHLLSVESEVTGPRATLTSSWPRSGCRVTSVQPKFMRDEVLIEIDGEPQLKLYANRLRTNPWAAELVRLLGGQAPEPLDLG